MSYFLRDIGRYQRVSRGISPVDGGDDPHFLESTKVSKKMADLIYRCAENTCKGDILKIPASVINEKDRSPDIPAPSIQHTLDVMNSKFVVGPPSSFACIAMAKYILSRYGPPETTSEIEINEEEAGTSKAAQDADERAARNNDKLVGASLKCVFDVLCKLSRRDSDLCVKALESLLELIENMPVECLKTENKLSVASMMSVLKFLRQDSCSQVSSLASSCMVALAVACGEPEHLMSAVESLICMRKDNESRNDSGFDRIQIPENLRRLLLKTCRKVHSRNDTNSNWSSTSIDEHAISCSFDLPMLPETSPDDTPDDDHRLYAAIASDGAYVYVLNYVGLYKLGTGLQETILAKLYATNQSLKATKNCAIYLCNGSLYLRRSHSSCIQVIEKENLLDIGEIILPPNAVQNAIFTDGSNFYNASLTANSTFTAFQLNDSFSPSDSISRKNFRITDVNFSSFGDTRTPHTLPKFLPANLHSQAVDLHLSKDLAFLQARNGKIFYAGNGTKFGLHETGTTWMELVLPEPIVQMSVGADNIMFRSGAGHAWIASVDDKKRNGRLRRLTASNRRKVVCICATGHMYGYVTENGKCFLEGHHSMRVHITNQMLSGLENVHISTIALGKTHGVAISRSGHLYTWGLNNLNQCGRMESASTNSSPRHNRNESHQICAIGDHIWVNDMPTICTQCGLCSARGVACGRVARQKGQMCNCGTGESTCLRCGLCRPCGEMTEPAAPGQVQHVQFSSNAIPQRTNLMPARVVLSKGVHDVKGSSVSCGNFHTVLLAADRSVFTFGSNCHGQLGTGDTSSKTVPQRVNIPADLIIVQVAAGANHTVLRTSDGSVYTFGAYGKGQLARQAGDKAGWNATPGRVPGFGPGYGAFAGWIGAEGDTTIVHSHTALLSNDDVLDAQIVASKQNIFIFPREVGKKYIVIKRKSNAFEHHTIGGMGLYTSWAMEPSYDMLWCYNAAEMRVQAYNVFKKDENVEKMLDALDGLTFQTSPEFSIPLESPVFSSSTHLGILLQSATFSADLINHLDCWKDKKLLENNSDNGCLTDGYSVVNRFDGTGGGWGYSAHSIEAIQFKTNREIKLVGVGLYGGRGEYISKLKLYRLLGGEADELYVEQVTETDETMYDCGAHETATLLFSQPIIVPPNQWHVVSAKISGPSSDCGANGKGIVEGDGVTFNFRNSVVSNNGTDVNVGQIPELYYQVRNPEDKNEDEENRQNAMSMSRLFSKSCSENITPQSLGYLLTLLESGLRNIQEESGENIEKQWMQERSAFIALVSMRLLSRFVKLIYKENSGDDEPNIDFANKLVHLHSTLLEFFSIDIHDFEESSNSLSQCLAEAVHLFISLSHCFLGSKNLINAHLVAVMSRRSNTKILTAAVVGSIAKMEKISHRLLASDGEDRYPLLASLLTKHFTCDRETLTSLTSFSNVIRFLYDQTFQDTSSFIYNTAKMSEEIIVKISRELAIPEEDGVMGPIVHQTSLRFRRRSAQPTWDMSEGYADALSFRVDSEGIRLHGFGIYLPLEIEKRHFVGEIFMLSTDGSEKWSCLLSVNIEMGPEEKEIGIIRFPDYVLLSPGVTYAIKLVMMTKAGKTFCGEGGVTQLRLSNGTRLFLSGCSISQNGTTVQRGQFPFLLYSVLDQSKGAQITQEMIHETYLLLLRLISTKIGAALANNDLPECGRSLISRMSPHVMVFMERFPDKSLEIMSTLEMLIPLVSNINGTAKTGQLGDSRESELDETACLPIVVESPHPYKPNSTFSMVIAFNEYVDFMCIRFSPNCETAQFDDQLTIYLGVDGHSYMPIERCYGSHDWPAYPIILPGNSLWFTLDTSTEVEGATAEQMFGFHVTVTGYIASEKDSNLRLEQELVWLSANACRIMTQLPINPKNMEYLSTAEDDTRHLFEKHGSLLKKGLSLSHCPTLSELINKGHPPAAQSPDLQFLREFLVCHPSTSPGFLARWLPTGPVIEPSKCQLGLSHEELIVGKAVQLRLSCRDQFDREVDCPKLQVEVFATIGNRNSSSNSAMAKNLPGNNLPSALLIQQNPFQPIISNHARYMNICAMPAYANYSIEEIRLGFMKEDLVKDRIQLKPKGQSVFAGSWTPTSAGNYRIECKVDGYDISHTYTVEVVDRNVKNEEKISRRGAQMTTAKTVIIPFSSDFSGIRMRMGTTLASTCVGVIPRGAIIELIEEIENDDGKWVRLTDETALLYGCTIGSGQVWCLAYHRALRRELIPLGEPKEKTVKLRKKEDQNNEEASKHHSVSIDAMETYILGANDILQVYSLPAPHAMIQGEKIRGPCELMSSGWMTNRHGVWIKMAGVDKYVLQQTDDNLDSSLTFSTNGNDEEELVEVKEVRKRLATALPPSVTDCIRAVFAAFVWHEHLVKDLMAAAAYLRFHQNLHNIWQACDIPSCTNAPAALQPIVKIWREICEVVQTSVEQHLIMPPVSSKAMLTESIRQNPSACELCDENFKAPLTVHLRMAHPGCGGDCHGYGYNSSGKFTTGWSGECGTGGRGQAPWYLMCNNCRSQYLRKTPAGHHQERTRRWREFRFSTSASEARPEVIIRQNALFLLDLNARLQTDSNTSSAATSGWTINLFPTHSSTPSTIQRNSKKANDTSIAKSSYMATSLIKGGCSSDPGPKVSFIVSPPGNFEDQTASLNRPTTEPLEVLQSPSAALRTLFSNTNPSTSALLKRPVLAFCVEHHDLKRIRSACVQSVRRAVAFSHAFRVWNWLLRMVSSETSVSDVILQYLTSLTSYNRLAEYIYATKKNSNILPHPWRLCFLAGPIAGEMVTQLHSFLHTVSIILQSSGVDGRLRSLCFKAWTLQLTAQEQDLLILTCNILATVGGVLSDTSINEMSPIGKPDCEVKEMQNVTKFVKINASSRQAMVICLTDESGETFWESGDEDKNRSRVLTVQIDDDVLGILLSIFIDNVRDDAYKVTNICFKAILADGGKKELNNVTLDNNFCGWVKCCVAMIKHLQIVLKGPGQSCRARQLIVHGSADKPGDIAQSLRPSTSHHLFFSNTQRDAFALFQAISSQAFCGELSEDDTLRERVIDLLFSRVQLYPLQNYVYNQVVQAMEREVELLCNKTKRNYSYCCGLMGLLVRICDSRGSLDNFGQKSSILTSITQLLIFAPVVVQRQCLNSLECIFGSFSPSSVEVSRVMKNLLVVVGKVVQLQVRDKVAHTVVTVHLCSSVQNAPQNWRVDRPIDTDIGRQTAQLVANICNGSYSKEWSDAGRCELANCLLNLIQMPESLSCSSLHSSSKSSSIVASKRFWLAISSLALMKDKQWLDLSERWRSVQEQVDEEPVTMCENHDDGHTTAQVFCIDCDIALCKECFTIMHLHKKNRNHGVKNLAQSNAQYDININQGCARMRYMNLLILFYGEALNGMVEISGDLVFPSMQTSSNIVVGTTKEISACRFCGNFISPEDQNADGTCSHEDCLEYAKTACANTHSCGHLCGGIRGESDCLDCMKCKPSEANQAGDDICVICFTERLGAAPCVKLQCGHILHYHCVRMVLEKRWNGPRIVFRFIHCPLCYEEISHPGLLDLMEPLLAIRQEVIEKAKMRLEYDGLLESAAIADPRSEFHNRPEEYALDRYMYVLCHKCKKAYFGGESRCQAALDTSQYNPEELICGACSDTDGVQVCPRHGVEYLEYKCRFCCSIAVYFCFGTTHFCAPCHNDFQRLMSLPKTLLNPCPVGPQNMPMEDSSQCPLKMKHPPTGEEFAMGCGICRNISTF